MVKKYGLKSDFRTARKTERSSYYKERLLTVEEHENKR